MFWKYEPYLYNTWNTYTTTGKGLHTASKLTTLKLAIIGKDVELFEMKLWPWQAGANYIKIRGFQKLWIASLYLEGL